jgi:hypothetical protein
MRKRIITPTPSNIPTRSEGWLDVEGTSVVEVTSEDKDCPVEAVLDPEMGGVGVRQRRGEPNDSPGF